MKLSGPCSMTTTQQKVARINVSTQASLRSMGKESSQSPAESKVFVRRDRRLRISPCNDAFVLCRRIVFLTCELSGFRTQIPSANIRRCPWSRPCRAYSQERRHRKASCPCLSLGRPSRNRQNFDCPHFGESPELHPRTDGNSVRHL